jgi:hypothetical protein
MNAKQLIQSYQEAQQEEHEKAQLESQEVSQEAQRVLMESCKTWLNGLLDEFELGEIQANGNNWPHSFSIYLPFTWQGAVGKVTMYWRSDNNYGLDKPALQFKFDSVQRRVANNSYEHKIRLELPFDVRMTFGRFFYFHPAGAVETSKLGKFLIDVQAELAERAELDKRDAELVRERDIDWRKGHFGYRNVDLAKHFGDCVEKYPEMIDEWRRLFSQREAEDALEEQQRIERQEAKEQFRADRNAEKERIQQEADAKFERCIIYRIQYGAHVQVDIEESQYYTDEVIVLDDKPDADGWYLSITAGDIKRVKLPNIIRIDELICLNRSDVPTDYHIYPFATGVIHSQNYEDLSAGYLIIPPLVKRFKPPQDLVDIINRGAEKG